MDTDMNMDMPMSSTGPATSIAMPSMSSMGAMSGMASTFSIDTHVTLLFTDWKTSTPAAYIFTIFFLFALGIFNRFLGALKSQLEQRWKYRQEHTGTDNATGHTRHGHERQKSLSVVPGHKRKWSHTMRPGPPPRLDEEEQEFEPLSPAPVDLAPLVDEKSDRGPQGFWRPSSPWSVRRDGIRAVLEFLRALIGYIL
jgi:hypothetical protein